MKKGTKGGKLGTALRQGYQGLTLGFGDEGIDALGALYAAAMTGEDFSNLYKDARGMTKEDFARDTKNAPKTSLASNIVGGVIPGAAAGAKTLAQVGLGALSGFGSENGSFQDRAGSAGAGAAFGLGGQYLSKGLNRVAKGASDKIAPAAKATADKLKSMGIPVRLSQLMDSKFLQAIDTAISKVPFSGANKSQETQRKAFTRELTKTFGEDADTITEDLMGNAKTRLGGEYDRILGGKVLPMDRKSFAQGLGPLIDDFGLQTGDKGWAKDLQDNILGNLDNNIKQSGGLTGESYKAMRGTLKGASATNAKARDLLKYLDDEVRKVAPNDIAKELGVTDEQYRNMKITEKLYGQLQNSSGQIKPETLYNAAKPNVSSLAYGGGGDLGDLARAGRQLKPTIPDSGTATQLLGAGALGGAGTAALFEPTIAAGALGTIGLSAGLNKAMTSNYLQEGFNPALQAGAQAFENSGVAPTIARSLQGQAVSGENVSAPSYDPSADPVLAGMLKEYTPAQDTQLQQMMEPAGPPQPDKFGPQQPYDPENDPELQQLLAPQQQGSNDVLSRIKMAESGGNLNAKNPNSSASGTYQFTDPTWRGMVKNYGAQTGITEADKNNPTAQQKMAELLTQENTNMYKQAGIEPNDKDIYLAHFLGGPSAVKAKKALGTGAYGEQLFPQAAKANKNIFYKGGRPRTVDEIYNILGAKVS